MLGKLLKYDIKFGKTPFLAMSSGMVLFGIFTRLLFGSELVMMFGMSAFVVLVVGAIAMASVILVSQHFTKNLFSDEGYLMMTLPVKRHMLIVSKLITSLLWFNVMILAALVTGIIMFDGGLTTFTRDFGMVRIYVTLIVSNIIAVNGIFLLYLISTIANVSVMGRRVGFPASTVASIGFIVLEILFGNKVMSPLFDGLAICVVNDRGITKAYISRNVFDLYGDGLSSVLRIELSFLVMAVTFSILGYLAVWYCLKSRVDLQ